MANSSTNVFFRVLLTVADSGGRSATISRDVFPRTSVLTLASQPSGLQLRIDGQAVRFPMIPKRGGHETRDRGHNAGLLRRPHVRLQGMVR